MGDDWYERTIGYYPKALYQGTAPTGSKGYGALRNLSKPLSSQKTIEQQQWAVRNALKTSDQIIDDPAPNGPTLDEVATRVYPLLWFRQMQTYVKALLDNKPDSTEEKVYWSLMLMGAIGQGMFAFNANDLTWDCFLHGSPSPAEQNSLVADQDNPEGWFRRNRPITQVPYSQSHQAPQLSQLVRNPVLSQRSHALPRLGRIWPVAYENIRGQKVRVPTYERIRRPGWVAFRPNRFTGPDRAHQQPWLLTPTQAQAWIKEREFGTSGSSGTKQVTYDIVTNEHLTQLAGADAPFLRLPLISFQNRANTYTYSGARYSGVGVKKTGFRASWWEQWIASPCSAHIPWANQAGALFFEPPARIGRWYSLEKEGWQGSRLYVDNHAKRWIDQERASLSSPWNKRGMLLAMWNFFAFTARYDNVLPVCQERSMQCGDTTGDKWGSPQKTPFDVDQPWGDFFFATLPDIVRDAMVAWGDIPNPYPLYATRTYDESGGRKATSVMAVAEADKVFTHKTAWQNGTYDAWAEWFIGLDLPGNLDALHNALYIYNAQGAISGRGVAPLGDFSEATGLNETYKPEVFSTVFMTKDGADDIKDQETWFLAGEALAYVINAVELVASLWTGNVIGAMQALNSIKDATFAAANRAGIYPWDCVATSPEGMLRTLNATPGPAGWCTYAQASGQEAENQKQRFSTQTDVQSALRNATEQFKPYEAMYLKPYGRTSSVSVSTFSTARVQALLTRVTDTVQVKPPSQGGPKYTPPVPKITLIGKSKRDSDLWKWGLWGLAAAVGGYAVVKYAPSKYTEPVTRPLKPVTRQLKPLTSKVKSAGRSVSQKGRALKRKVIK